MTALLNCKQLLLGQAWDLNLANPTAGGLSSPEGDFRTYMNSFQNFLSASPDFLMVLSSDFLQHMDSAAPSAFVLPSTNSLLNTSNGNNNRIPGPGGGGLAANTYADPGANVTLAGGGFTMATMNDFNAGLPTYSYHRKLRSKINNRSIYEQVLEVDLDLAMEALLQRICFPQILRKQSKLAWIYFQGFSKIVQDLFLR